MPEQGDVLRTKVGEIDIAYDTVGEATDPPVLLIAGLGTQLIGWDDGFCQELVDRQLFVIRFDNRDVGLSSHLVDKTPPGPSATDDPPTPVYTLAQMAADAAGLIKNLSLDSAHVVGTSMGGAIAQILAIEHPELVRSLTSIGSSTSGHDWMEQASEAALSVLTRPPASTREEVIDRAVQFHRAVGSPAYPTDESEIRGNAARAFNRAFDPAGVERQVMAAMTARDLTERAHGITQPTLVIHGAQDPLVVVDQGRATAEAILGAELVVIDGMGHDIPKALWPTVAEHISRLVAEAEQRKASPSP